MREALKRVDAKKYLLSILTSYVKKVPPALEEALLMIRDLRSTLSSLLRSLLFVLRSSSGPHTQLTPAWPNDRPAAA
jgi:hypothetical protein